MEKLKIGLFLEHTPYVNPTENIYINLITKNFQSSIFDGNKIEDNRYMEKFLSENNIFITHLYSLYFLKYGKTHTPHLPINFKKIILNSKKIFHILSSLDKPVFILFTRSDWYSEDESYWEKLPDNFYLLGGFKKGYLNINAKTENFLRYHGGHIEMGNKFVEDKRIIPLTHIVSKKELMNYGFKHKKKYDFFVLGAKYKRRRLVYESVKQSSISIGKSVSLKVLFKLSILNKKSYFYNFLLNYLFHKKIFESRISYTDGSELNAFVRKFVEIPTFKSMLLCDPFEKMDHYGFIENKHYVKIDYNNIIDQIKFYLKNEDLRNELINNAYNLILNNFSEEIYLKRLKEIFWTIKNNNFKEAKWESGKFIVEKH